MARHAASAAEWFVELPETRDSDWAAREAELRRLAARDARVERWFYALVLTAVSLTFGAPLVGALLR